MYYKNIQIDHAKVINKKKFRRNPLKKAPSRKSPRNPFKKAPSRKTLKKLENPVETPSKEETPFFNIMGNC